MGDVNTINLALSSDNACYDAGLLCYGIRRLPLPETRITRPRPPQIAYVQISLKSILITQSLKLEFEIIQDKFATSAKEWKIIKIIQVPLEETTVHIILNVYDLAGED
ncbi:hypothetical protein J6590_006942 [Homalodisca vitripennis]|nr:hypothetical protein J6590_006942 [Homalodisca vitripennis]